MTPPKFLSEIIETSEIEVIHLYGDKDGSYYQSFCFSREFWDKSKNYGEPTYQGVSRSSYEKMKQVAVILAKSLEQVLPYAEYGIPSPPHLGSCTPETSCDMDCSHAFHGSNVIWDAKNNITRAKEIMEVKE